jgi:hypothetical protein
LILPLLAGPYQACAWDGLRFRIETYHGMGLAAPPGGEELPGVGEVSVMPEKKHLRGVGEKEQRQYEHIKESAENEGRYGERAEEVAARTVLKQHKEKGHKKGR